MDFEKLAIGTLARNQTHGYHLSVAFVDRSQEGLDKP
jgi:hypothetical protein